MSIMLGLFWVKLVRDVGLRASAKFHDLLVVGRVARSANARMGGLVPLVGGAPAARSSAPHILFGSVGRRSFFYTLCQVFAHVMF